MTAIAFSLACCGMPLTCTTGATTAGTVDVVVTVSGQSGTLSGGYTYGTLNPQPVPMPTGTPKGSPQPQPGTHPTAPPAMGAPPNPHLARH